MIYLIRLFENENYSDIEVYDTSRSFTKWSTLITFSCQNKVKDISKQENEFNSDWNVDQWLKYDIFNYLLKESYKTNA